MHDEIDLDFSDISMEESTEKTEEVKETPKKLSGYFVFSKPMEDSTDEEVLDWLLEKFPHMKDMSISNFNTNQKRQFVIDKVISIYLSLSQAFPTKEDNSLL